MRRARIRQVGRVCASLHPCHHPEPVSNPHKGVEFELMLPSSALQERELAFVLCATCQVVYISSITFHDTPILTTEVGIHGWGGGMSVRLNNLPMDLHRVNNGD